MAVKLKTGRIDLKDVQTVTAAIKLVATPEFASEAMNIPQVGRATLKYLKSIFPRSPRSYPYGRDPSHQAQPLVNGWMVFFHPPGFTTNKGFTVRRKDSSLNDHLIIRSLDQGTKAYERRISGRSSFLKTDKAALQPRGQKSGKIGDYVFMTGTNMVLKYKPRRGLQFMDKTYTFALTLLEEAKARYKIAAKRKLRGRG